ncbi:lipoprotein NlpI [Shewanella sp. NIFS-20-20]|uniref:lipoprotein NlpI n=1 Tax=Shewanella sp. NIFS-20-20 TaxID=2853806 RepID=UPI001C45D9B1|nr:lipoprotein NlpI [Shewanella sp. NIFS-20-20]MBV7315502.1 lipoprotein NlpI [Shewanella sp. NIFS-20-20]
MKFISQLKVLALLVCTSAISGCATTTFGPEQASQGRLQIVPPLPAYEQEVTLAKLNEILASVELTPAQRARFLYERGVLHDSVGLRLLSRIDFHQALKIQPDLADAYNFLGIYYTQEGEYASAFEAFDGVLELAPSYDYAYLNRGIALHYAGRDNLAEQDLQTFVARQPNDPYRLLWLYLIQAETQPELALQTLAQNRGAIENDTWASVLVDFYLGKATEDQVFAAAKAELTSSREYAQRLCEAYFYLAKTAIANKQYEKASNYLRLALATNIYDFVEHRYARMELGLIQQALQDGGANNLLMLPDEHLPEA